MPDVLSIIHRELNDAEATGYKRVVHIRVTMVHIRVTTDALPGSPVSVPVTPERARVLGTLVARRVTPLVWLAVPTHDETQGGGDG